MPEDGKIARLRPGAAGIIDEAHSGRLHLDGKLIVESEDGPARARRRLSFNGAVFVSIAIAENGELEDLQAVSDGLPPSLVPHLSEWAEEAFDGLPRARRKDDSTLGEAIRTAIRRGCDDLWGKKPVCRVIVLRA